MEKVGQLNENEWSEIQSILFEPEHLQPLRPLVKIFIHNTEKRCLKHIWYYWQNDTDPTNVKKYPENHTFEVYNKIKECTLRKVSFIWKRVHSDYFNDWEKTETQKCMRIFQSCKFKWHYPLMVSIADVSVVAFPF